MQVTINVPETLPPAIIKLRVQELEENLQQEAKRLADIGYKQQLQAVKFSQLLAIANECAQLPTLDSRSADEILGYRQSEMGLWDAD